MISGRSTCLKHSSEIRRKPPLLVAAAIAKIGDGSIALWLERRMEIELRTSVGLIYHALARCSLAIMHLFGFCTRALGEVSVTIRPASAGFCQWDESSACDSCERRNGLKGCPSRKMQQGESSTTTRSGAPYAGLAHSSRFVRPFFRPLPCDQGYDRRQHRQDRPNSRRRWSSARH